MADSKITALTALTAADPVNDMFPIVDVSDTTMAASGTTKRISANNILSSSPTASGALTVTGLVTAGSAAISGDLTVDTSTLKVDSGANKVGIGTTTMNGALTVKNPNVAVDSSIYTIQAATSTSQLSSWTINQNTDVVSFGTDYAGALSLKTNSVQRLVIANSGNVTVSTGDLVMATSGKGIDFSATASGSGTMTSELLNDYEEGTWVPTDASGAGLAFTVSNCRYTKVGRSVTIQGAIVYPATANASNATWGGFPFNSSDSFNLSIIYTDTSIANLTYISSNGTNAFLLTPGVNTLNSTVSGKYIAFSGTYMI